MGSMGPMGFGGWMRRVALAAVFVLMLGGLMAAPTAFAGSSVGSFEIEGNIKDDTGPGEPVDWATAGSGTPPVAVTTWTDPFGGQPDTIFTGGSKELEPAGWECKDDGSAPAKDDLREGAIGFRTIQNKQYIYARWLRFSNNGDAHIDYEFSQSAEPNPSCPSLPKRTVNDILITFDTDVVQGKKIILVRAFRWTGSTFTPLSTGSQGFTWDGAVNDPNDPTDPAMAGLAPRTFGELALNLTDTIGAFACGQFAKAYMKTRASTAINAALKDRTEAKDFNPGSCPQSSLQKSVRNVTNNQQFTADGPTSTTAVPGNTIEYRLVYKNTGPVPATGVVVTDNVQTGSTYVANSCTGGISCSFTSPTVTWQLGTVEPGGTRTLTFRVTINNTFTSNDPSIKNVGVVDTNEETPKNSNETTVNVTSRPDSELKKAVRNVTANQQFTADGPTSTTAKPGETIEYRITYKNIGTSPTAQFTIEDPIPANTTYVANSCSPACATTGNPVTKVTWTVSPVAPGDTRVFTFRVTIANPYPASAGPVTNVARACVPNEDPQCTDSPPTTVTVIQPPNSSLTKSAANCGQTGATCGTAGTTITAVPGDVILYTLTYTNSGGSAATNVVISDTITGKQTLVPNSCSATGNTTCSGTTVSWTFASVPAGETRVVTFRTKLDESFPAGTTPVTNVGRVDTNEEPPKDSNPTTVNVTASPNTSPPAKTARNCGPTGTTCAANYATNITANPGDVIEYKIVVTNSGNAPATNVVVSDTVQGPYQTLIQNSCDSSPQATSTQCNSSPVTWTYSSLAAGATATMTFRTRLVSSIPNGTEIRNVARVCTDQEPQCKEGPPTIITVTSSPNLQLAKSANRTEVTPGGTITYTLTYSNTGNAPATGVVITERIPDGTTFVSCTGGCSEVSGDPPQTTWNVGTVNPGDQPGSVTLTVEVDDDAGCEVCNLATIHSATQNNGAPVSSNNGTPLCIGNTPVPNPSEANASGSATGAHAEVGLLGLNLTLPENSSGDPDDPSVSSSQHGVGADGEENEFLGLDVAPVLQASILRTSSNSTVTEEPAQARNTSVAETLGVKVLPGAVPGIPAVVEASVVRSVASATARGDGSSFSNAGSTFENLKVLGQQINNVTPGQVVDLPDLLFGSNSYVKLLDVQGNTSEPPADQVSGGTYAASVTVTMIRVRADNVVGLGKVDVIVSQASAAADFPQTRLCPPADTAQAVSGHAFIAYASLDSDLTAPEIDEGLLLTNYVSIPTTGGHQNKSANTTILPDDGSLVTSKAVESDSAGTRDADSSDASSFAQAKDLCILPDAVTAGQCTIGAQLVRSQANSTANAGGASSSDTGTNLVKLTILGQPIPVTPPRNTVIPLGPLGFVVLNEQTCDDGGTPPTCAGGTHSGLTVRAIRVVLTVPLDPLLRGAEIIVAEAHSDATFAPLGD